MIVTYYGREVEAYLDDAINPTQYRKRVVPKPMRQEDRVIVGNYMSERVSLKPSTAKVVCTYLVMFSRAMPRPLTEITTRDVLDHIKTMNQSLKPNTRRRYYPIIKVFLKWMQTEGTNNGVSLEKVNPNLKAPALDLEGRKPSMMLSGDNIKQMIATAHTSRDRALIAVMFEGGLRPIEVISADWSDIVFDRHGAQFSTNKKTGKSRYIRLIWSAPYLSTWKNDHPQPTPGTPVFISFKKPNLQPLTQTGLKTFFYGIAKTSGINKKIFPYLLRHSRITAMQNDEIPESVIKLQSWGSVNSRMLGTYSHMGNSDIDRILLTRAGIMCEERRASDAIKALQCSRCGRVHGPTAKFCEDCGTPMSESAKNQVQTDKERLQKELQEWQEFKKFVADQKR